MLSRRIGDGADVWWLTWRQALIANKDFPSRSFQGLLCTGINTYRHQKVRHNDRCKSDVTLMDRPNLGFALFLALLLIGPSIPVPGLAVTASLSPAAAGLVVWFMLAPRLPVRAVLTMPTVLGLIGFSIYVLLVSMVSGRLISITYALQYTFYTVLGGVLIPAYLVHKLRQGRELEAWRVVAWVGAIYAAGIIVSLWTGPIYSFQDAGGKHYGSLLILRAHGFSESVNAAGGIAALISVFYLFLYPPSRLQSAVLASLSVTGLVLTLSRSAIVAFTLAVCVLGALLVFRALFLRGKVGRLRLRLVPVGFVALVIVAGIASYQQPMVAAAWERLVLDQEYLDRDVDTRLEHWSEGAERWANLSPAEQTIGAGFRGGAVHVSRGTFITAHNVYLEMLGDFGIIGLLTFLAVLAASTIGATRLILLRPKESLARFCFCGLVILIVHNMTEVFFYDMATLIWLILLLTCNELAGRRAVAVTDGPVGALIPASARDSAFKAGVAGARRAPEAMPR
jgi:hypothetical protein